MNKSATALYGRDWSHESRDPEGQIWSSDRIQLILLQEIRDELVRLRLATECTLEYADRLMGAPAPAARAERSTIVKGKLKAKA